jgi:hypothetical protein
MEAIEVLASTEFDEALREAIRSIRIERKELATKGRLKRTDWNVLEERGLWDNNEKLINEWSEILAKQSTLPHGQRAMITRLCSTVFHLTYQKIHAVREGAGTPRV